MLTNMLSFSDLRNLSQVNNQFYSDQHGQEFRRRKNWLLEDFMRLDPKLIGDVRTLTIDEDCPQLIWPPHLTTLYIGDNNLPSIFPQSLRTLVISGLYSSGRDIFAPVLSLDGLVTLRMGELENWNRPLPARLPRSLTHIDLPRDFNQVISVGTLPPRLRILKIGYQFNHPLTAGVLPSGLEVLFLGKEFNQPLRDDTLPSTLIDLRLGVRFNYPLTINTLPKGLEVLIFSQEFNQPIADGVLPEQLRTLSMGDRFNQPIGIDTLPKLLTVLNMGEWWNSVYGVAGMFPPNLTSLTCRRLPKQRLEHLITLRLLLSGYHPGPNYISFFPSLKEVFIGYGSTINRIEELRRGRIEPEENIYY